MPIADPIVASPAAISPESVTGVVLTGGAGSRMGGSDKGLTPLAGRPMIEYVLEALRPQVGKLLLSANRNHEQYARYGIAVVTDEQAGFQGPLAGIAAAMRAARTDFLVTAPCDSPFVPPDLVARLAKAVVSSAADIGAAHDGTRIQPVFALLRTTLLHSLLAFLERGERKVDCWIAGERIVTADFSDLPEAFLNINTPEEARAIEERMREPFHAAR